MLALVVLLKFWQPATIWSFEHEERGAAGAGACQPPGLYRRPQIEGLDALDSALGVRLRLGPDRR